MRHVVSVLLENETGALSRVVGLFSQRGYNIESLTVAPTEDKTISRLTVVTLSDDDLMEQITKQLHKLINVVTVSSLSDEQSPIEREILFLKLKAVNRTTRDDVKLLSDIFKAEIVDITSDIITLLYVGTSEQVDRFIKVCGEQSDIIETIRSGVCGIARGSHCLHI